MSENLSDRLKRHTLNFWEAEDNEEPAEKADACVKSEGSRWGDAFHHG